MQDKALDNQRIFQGILILSFINIGLLCLAFFLGGHPKEPAYYAVERHQNGQVTGALLQPLIAPIISNQALINWVIDAASSLYTYDQANYKTQIAEVISTYFTPKGGDSFETALKNTGVIDQLVAQKMEVTAVVENQPAILKSGTLSGRQIWKIQLPLLVTYVTASETQQLHFIVTLLVLKVPPTESPEGLAIDQLWVNQATAVSGLIH